MAETKLNSEADVQVAHARLVNLLHANDPEAAIDFAETLSCDARLHHRCVELRAVAYTEGGELSKRRDLIERGAGLWRELKSGDSAHVAYNLANAELAIWQTAVGEAGVRVAWEHDREHLWAARTNYEQVGRDETAPPKLRCMALTNAGNSYDAVARYVDAIALYDEALAIDPNFAMALGNRGIALKYFAPFMREHAGRVRQQASADLGLALQNIESLTQSGTPHAARQFQAELDSLPPETGEPTPAAKAFSEPYLRWCARHKLFLHVWPVALSENDTHLDALFLGRLEAPMAEDGLARLKDLIDAFNALKQDYVSARYSTWLADDKDSPIGAHSAEMSSRTLFIDSGECARWGIRTGIMIQAMAAATNVLDKVDGFVHLYLGTSRVRDVYFGSLARSSKNGPIDIQLQTALDLPEHNVGLLALLDLSEDLGRDTVLSRHMTRRHAATHRFVVAHNIMVPEANHWMDRVEWLHLIGESLRQFKTARAALMYLAGLVDRHESANRARSLQSSVRLSMPSVDTRLSELL